jgi:hypothetical protein
MGIITAIANGLKLLAGLVGWGKQRDSEKNAADVKAAAEAQDEQNAQDRTRKAIAHKDIDEERRELAE